MATYTFDGYRWTGTLYGAASCKVVVIKITETERARNQFNRSFCRTQTITTSDGLAKENAVYGGSLLPVRMDFGSDGTQDAVEIVAFINVAGAGWYFIPLPGSGFQTGDTVLGNNAGWADQCDDLEYADAVCFTPGTRIATPCGARRIGALAVGDLVITRDSGLQAIRWIGRKTITGARLHANPGLRPVCIRKSAFGPGLPDRDLRISPHHRLLLAGYKAEPAFGSHEVLIAANNLVFHPLVHIDTACTLTEYIHLLFNKHEVITANGIQTESFHPGTVGMDAIEEAARFDLFEKFPEIRFSPQTFGPSARQLLNTRDARLICA